MNIIDFRKKFISATSLSSIAATEFFTILGLYALTILQIQHVYIRIFVITILFLIINVVIFIICMFCVASYQNIHRIFLVSIIVIYSITLGFLSYFLHAFSYDFLEATSNIWEREIQKSINKIESRFNCKGFDKSRKNSTCYEPIETFLNTRSKIGSFLLAVFSALFGLFALISIYFLIRSKNSDMNEPNIMKLSSQELNDIKEPINLDDNLNI